MVDQQRDVLSSHPQRRDVDRRALDAEVQVFAELTVLDPLGQVGVRRADDSNVHPDGVVRADPKDLAALQDPQQLGLHRPWHVADLVEEHRSPVGVFEAPRPIARRASVGAFYVSEQLILQQRLGQPRAVDGDEAVFGAARVLVNGGRQQLLARSGLAQDQDRYIRPGQRPDGLQDGEHLAALADDVPEAVLLVQPLAQLLDGAAVSGLLGCSAHDGPQLG